jgi:hypothetical protein
MRRAQVLLSSATRSANGARRPNADGRSTSNTASLTQRTTGFSYGGELKRASRGHSGTLSLVNGLARGLLRRPCRKLLPYAKEEMMAHEQYADCIEACETCARECEHCATSCLQEQNVKMMAECIRLDRDCADVCRLAAALMSRDSRFASEFCQLCARVCDACGDECARHQAEHCQRCADICRKCAEACRRMSARGGRAGVSHVQHA